MAKSAPVLSDRPLSTGPNRSAERAIDRPPEARAGRRAIEVTALAVGVAGVMLVLELGKQWLHPDITVWESHIITVVFSGVAVALAGYVILRRRDVLHDRIVVEAVERRHAQQHIHMLAHTVRSVGECVSVTDMNDRVIFVNKAFLDTYGFEESDLLGRPIAVVRSDKNREEVALEVFPATLRGGWRGELWNRKKDGTDFQIFLSTSIVRDDAGAPVALVGVARDITEEKRTEEALKRGRESDRIVTLAAGIAHEFNNLLQIVLTSTALALEDVPADGPARGCLQSVVHASERASNLTAQLLVYAGRGTLVRFTVFDLNDEIRERAAFIRALMPPAAIFDLDLASGSALIRADRQQIQQVLTSLVTNAAEAMADRPGRASVRTRIEDVAASDPRPWVAGERIAPGRYVCLSVEDQGVGMEAETISRIFDPFFSTKFLGRGMGLPAVLGVAHATGGAIAVDSTPGRGTRVTVAFPCPPADS